MYHNWQSYDVCVRDIECDEHNFCHFGLFFAFLPTNNPENQILEKMKKCL